MESLVLSLACVILYKVRVTHGKMHAKKHNSYTKFENFIHFISKGLNEYTCNLSFSEASKMSQNEIEQRLAMLKGHNPAVPSSSKPHVRFIDFINKYLKSLFRPSTGHWPSTSHWPSTGH